MGAWTAPHKGGPLLGGINVHIQAQEMPYAYWRVGFYFRQRFRQRVFFKTVHQTLLKKLD